MIRDALLIDEKRETLCVKQMIWSRGADLCYALQIGSREKLQHFRRVVEFEDDLAIATKRAAHAWDALPAVRIRRSAPHPPLRCALSPRKRAVVGDELLGSIDDRHVA